MQIKFYFHIMWCFVLNCVGDCLIGAKLMILGNRWPWMKANNNYSPSHLFPTEIFSALSNHLLFCLPLFYSLLKNNPFSSHVPELFCEIPPLAFSSDYFVFYHCGIHISATSNVFSCAIFTAHDSVLTLLYTFPWIFTFIRQWHNTPDTLF